MSGSRKLKIKKQPVDLKIDYDHDYDILYITVGKPIPSYSDEANLKGVYIRRGMENGRINGATVMDFSKRNKQTLCKYIPFKIDFTSLV